MAFQLDSRLVLSSARSFLMSSRSSSFDSFRLMDESTSSCPVSSTTPCCSGSVNSHEPIVCSQTISKYQSMKASRSSRLLWSPRSMRACRPPESQSLCRARSLSGGWQKEATLMPSSSAGVLWCVSGRVRSILGGWDEKRCGWLSPFSLRGRSSENQTGRFRVHLSLCLPQSMEDKQNMMVSLFRRDNPVCLTLPAGRATIRPPLSELAPDAWAPG